MQEETKRETHTGFEISYWIDSADVIVNTDEGWEKSVRENRAPELDGRRIIGRNLLSFVEGDVTRMYVRTLLQAARLQRATHSKPYRCDSPEAKRYMEMRLTLEPSGLLRLDHRVVKVEPMLRPMRFALAPRTGRTGYVVRCSMCNRLKSAGGWEEPDVAAIDPPAGNEVSVIYGVCPDCLAGIRR